MHHGWDLSAWRCKNAILNTIVYFAITQKGRTRPELITPGFDHVIRPFQRTVHQYHRQNHLVATATPTDTVYSSSRGAESLWGCSESDPGSDSNPGSDTKYKINNTLIVERVSAVEATKDVAFPIDFGFHSFGRKIVIPVSLIQAGSHLPPPQELRLPDHLFVQIMLVGASPRRRPA